MNLELLLFYLYLESWNVSFSLIVTSSCFEINLFNVPIREFKLVLAWTIKIKKSYCFGLWHIIIFSFFPQHLDFWIFFFEYQIAQHQNTAQFLVRSYWDLLSQNSQVYLCLLSNLWIRIDADQSCSLYWFLFLNHDCISSSFYQLYVATWGKVCIKQV